MLRNFSLVGRGGDYGVLSYYQASDIIWSLDISGFKISIGAVGAQKLDIWDTFTKQNGIPANSLAEPNIWIKNSQDVTVLYGELRGRADGPGGDGEFAAYGSQRVNIEGLHVIDSGASAIYLVDCDDCSVKEAVIERPGEWGLDIVGGSTRFVAEGNDISGALFGGSVYEATSGSTATYRNNRFSNNRRFGVGSCNGINVKGALSNVTMSGNTSTPSGVICAY